MVDKKDPGPKVGRNSPCPCGSGKKYKQCHGKGATAGDNDGDSVTPLYTLGTLKTSLLTPTQLAAVESAHRIFDPVAAEREEWSIDSKAPLTESFGQLAKQASDVESSILKIIVEDTDTVCADFGLEKHDLSESQAQVFLNEVLKARDVDDQRRHDLRIRIVSAVAAGVVGLLLGFAAS